MRRAIAGNRLHAFVAQRGQIDTGEQGVALPEQHWPDGQVQLVDEPRAQILTDRRHAAAQPDISTARRLPRLSQRGVNAIGDKPKLRAARHAERWPRMMGQDEHRSVIGRLVAPPALPFVVRPRAADRSEHVAAKNPGADAGEALRGDVVVDARLAAVLAVHVLPGSRGEEPLHQRDPADPDRILEILTRPRAVAIDRDREARDSEFSWLPGIGGHETLRM